MPIPSSFNGIAPTNTELDKTMDMLRKVAEATHEFASVDPTSLHEDRTKDFIKAQELANELSFKVDALIKEIQTRNTKVSSRFASTRNVIGGYMDKLTGSHKL